MNFEMNEERSKNTRRREMDKVEDEEQQEKCERTKECVVETVPQLESGLHSEGTTQ
jgi:hypothetical protein